MYDLIVVIAPKHRDEEIMEAAKRAGAKGGTILHGRSIRTKECRNLLGIVIEPEKDIVLILVKSELTEGIMNSVNNELRLDKTGQGMIMVFDAFEAIGLVD
jgi:hypothetical protein